MKIKTAIIPLVALLAANLAATAEPSPKKTEYFIRPLVAYLSLTDGDSTTGFGFAAGGSRGARKEHEVSFEWTHAKWDESITDSGVSVSGSVKYMPYLLGYRYYFGPEAPKARFYIGASAGMANVDVSVQATAPGVTFSGSDSAWASTLAGSVGVKFRLAANADLDLGYRYQHTSGPTITLVGENLELDDLKAHVVYLGVGFRF